MLLGPTGMENLRWICLHVSKPLALMPICRQTVAAAALDVDTKMNCSSADSLVHGCPSAGVDAPPVRSWSVIACCGACLGRSLGNAALMRPAYAVNRYFHSSNCEELPSYVGGGILYWCIVLTCHCCCSFCCLLIPASPADPCLLLLLGAHPDDRSRDHCSATMLKAKMLCHWCFPLMELAQAQGPWWAQMSWTLDVSQNAWCTWGCMYVNRMDGWMDVCNVM